MLVSLRTKFSNNNQLNRNQNFILEAIIIAIGHFDSWFDFNSFSLSAPYDTTFKKGGHIVPEEALGPKRL